MLVKFIILAAVLIGISFGYKQFAIWDASNPHDDESAINKRLLPLTPTVSDQEALNAKSQGIPIIDVRSEEEYASGHITGAILIPEQTLYETIPKMFPIKSQRIYLYCHSGHRGAVSTRLLRVMGYTNAFNIKNGLEGWESFNYPLQPAPLTE